MPKRPPPQCRKYSLAHIFVPSKGGIFGRDLWSIGGGIGISGLVSWDHHIGRLSSPILCCELYIFYRYVLSRLRETRNIGGKLSNMCIVTAILVTAIRITDYGDSAHISCSQMCPISFSYFSKYSTPGKSLKCESHVNSGASFNWAVA